MNINKYIYALLLMIYFMNSSKCIKIDPNAYEILEYKHKKEYVFDLTDGNEKIFYLKMEVDKILTNDCLINIHQTDPQIVTLYYTFDENKDFVTLYPWQTINKMEQHTMYYKIKKEENKKWLYMEIKVINFKDKQKFCVESTDFSTYDILEYNKKYEYVFDTTDGLIKIFHLKMEVDKILTNDCLINIYQTDPQIPILNYTFDENKDFVTLYNWRTINKMEQHTMYYKIKKKKTRNGFI